MLQAPVKEAEMFVVCSLLSGIPKRVGRRQGYWVVVVGCVCFLT